MNILIVDDNVVDREELKRTLSRGTVKCTFKEAKSVDQGFQLIRQHQFDLVLLDYCLPEKDGIELLYLLKQDPKLKYTAIVMISEMEQEEIAIQCLNAGAQDFLVKSKLTISQIWRSIVFAKTRYDLEKKLNDTYQQTKVLAEQDALTGIFNRFVFDKFIRISIANKPRDALLALVVIDLDNFKFVNDTYGHRSGDELLKQMTGRVKECLRGDEMFARIGGDEFAVILNNIDSVNSVGQIANRILKEFREPFLINSVELVCSCSMGIAFYQNENMAAEDLLKFADIAMYRAKNSGKNQMCFFKSSMQAHFIEQVEIELGLKTALIKDEFFLEYQPIYHTVNQQIIGVEALIRWQSKGERCPPDKFIPIAEKSSLILDIGRWVIHEAIKQLANWQQNHNPDLFMAINLSGVQLADSKLPSYLKKCLKEFNVEAKSLELEITETALLSDDSNEHQKKLVNKLDHLGCLFSLDDFGTGYSSVSYLQKFPIKIVKIDKSLTMNISENKTKMLMGALVKMLHSLDLKIIVEGIETQSSLDYCLELEVECAQGYFLSKPLHPLKVTELLQYNYKTIE